MRKVDESRAANYIRKHSNYKKWLAFVLCLSLLTGTVTLYILNKPATAMTEEGAESIGAILETASNADEETLIQQTMENKSVSNDNGDDDLFAGLNEDGDDNDENAGGNGDGDDLNKSGDDEEKQDDLVEEEVKEGEEEEKEEKEEAKEEDELLEDVVITVSYVDENGEAITDEKEIDIYDSLDFSEEAPSIDGYTFKEATYKEDAISKITVKKNADDIRYYEVTFADGDSKEIKKDATIVLKYTAEEKEEIVLTASYVDEKGKEIADEKELEIAESLDPKNDAASIEGYTFKEAKIGEDIVVLITAKEDEESGDKYYEATLEDESLVEIKEDKTVVFTYTEFDNEVTLTANFVDKDGEEIQESKDLAIGDTTELKKSEITEVDGYFFYKAIYEEKEITKIAPIFENKAKEEDSKAENSETEEETSVKAIGYELTTVDGDTIEITEDTEIEFSYLKASTETQFTFADGKVTVTAIINGKNVFPEGIELKAVEVTKNSSNYNYDAYMDALNENSESIAKDAGQDQNLVNTFTEDNTLLYDIAFVFEEKEIQPREGTVTVSIEFKKKQLTEDLSASSEENVTVVHLPITESYKEENEIENTEDANGISSADIDVITLTEATAAVEGNEKVEFEANSFSIFAVHAYQNHEAGTDDFLSVLGDAVNFGVVTNDLVLSGDSETNFAVKSVEFIGQQTGNDMTNPVEQTFIATDVKSPIFLKGEVAYFLIPSEHKTDYQRPINPQDNQQGQQYGRRWIDHQSRDKLIFDAEHEKKELEGIVDDLFAYTTAASRDLYENRTSIKNGFIKTTDGSGNYYIDVRNQTGKTFYYNVDQNELDVLKQNGKFEIYKNPDQVVVFNVTARGNIQLNKFSVWDGQRLRSASDIESTKKDTLARTIIWNFVNEVQVTTLDPVVGVFITGNSKSTWTNGGSSAGWLVFPHVSIRAGEWHNTYDNVVKISETAKFEANKTISGKSDHNISGFKFTLSRKDDSGWTVIESAYNGLNDKEDKFGNPISNDDNTNIDNDIIDPYNISFSRITYGNDPARKDERGYQYTSIKTDGATKNFVYKIEETAGYSDSQGNAYLADTREFYAKVTVTCSYWSDYTKNIYYRVSEPKYYTDESCTIQYTEKKVPVFDNTPLTGKIGLTINKYLGGADPGDNVFTFTVYGVKKDYSKLVELKKVHNVGSVIMDTFDIKDEYVIDGKPGDKNKYMFFVIKEETPTDKAIEGDKDYIIAKVVGVGTKDQYIVYFKYSEKNNQNQKGWIKALRENKDKDKIKKALDNDFTKFARNGKVSNKTQSDTQAFYNTGKGMLKIHKMVVNDFSSDLVRFNTGTALLENVTFRLTNLSDNSYIYFTGFVDRETKKNWAEERSADKKLTGNKYDVTYNRCAQWTITGLPAGQYLVEEVGDGLTFDYDPTKNTSTVKKDTEYSRITKYCVTTDPLLAPGQKNDDDKKLIGSDNKRKVFSCDLPEHLDIATPATVGGDVQTVQVCNYYSNPIGPIQVAKNFVGVDWTNEVFTFELTPKGGEWWYSEEKEHYDVEPNSQPMPDGKVGGTATASVSAEDQIAGKPGYAIAKFDNIPFRFEGNYIYEVKEVDPGLNDGIAYDKTVYTVEIQVRKKYVQFKREYTRDNMCNPENYSSDTTRYDEDFYYLGADVYYKNSDGTVIAKCELTLPEQPDTSEGAKNEFIAKYTVDDDLYNTIFTNTKTGELIITKVWFGFSGENENDAEGKHSTLSVDIWQRHAAHGDTPASAWKKYSTETLIFPDWSKVVTGIPLRDKDGAFEYTVKESDSYTSEYAISYSYGGQEYLVNNQKKITVEGQECYDTGYVMTLTGTSYGEVTITNRRVTTNSLPSTGGIGDIPYMAVGAGSALAGLLGTGLYYKKKKDEDQEED